MTNTKLPIVDQIVPFKEIVVSINTAPSIYWIINIKLRQNSTVSSPHVSEIFREPIERPLLPSPLPQFLVMLEAPGFLHYFFVTIPPPHFYTRLHTQPSIFIWKIMHKYLLLLYNFTLALSGIACVEWNG